MIDVPKDTVLDTPEYSNLQPEAIHFLKLVILDYCRKSGIDVLTPTQTINTILELQGSGHLRIIFFEDNSMRIQVTPKGSVDSWITQYAG